METAQRRETITKLSHIPGYSGGGEVSPWSLKGIANTVKGALQKTPEQIKRDAEMAEYRKNAEAERAAAKAPTATATPMATATPNAISTYAGNTVLDKRMAEAERKAGGGAIRGKGTGTSDEIPAMLSNGEYVIKAASANIAGKPLLDAINALADTKGKGAKKGALREMSTGVVHMFGGGSAEDEKNRIDALASQQKTAFAQQQANSNELVASGQRAVDAREAVLNITSPSVPQPTPAPAVSQNYPEESKRAPAVNAPAPTAAPTSAPAGAIPLGGGISKIEQPGKSPLFTNLAADDPSNVALMNRKPMTAQDQGAMDGIQARQDARDQALRDSAADQQNRDSSALQQLAARAVLEKQGASPREREAISARTADAERALQSDALARRGQDIQVKGMDQQAGALSASQKLAQSKLGLDQAKDSRESAASAMDMKSRQQLMDAQQEFLNAKTPDEQKAAERKLTTLGGKQTNDKGQVISLPDTLGDQGQVVRGGQAVLMPDGRIVRPEQGKAKSQGIAEGSISTVNGKTAKFIGGKWVPQ